MVVFDRGNSNQPVDLFKGFKQNRPFLDQPAAGDGDGSKIMVSRQHDQSTGIAGGTGKFATIAWSTDVSAAARCADDRYVFEASIPFKDFADAPEAGEKWGANFYRFVRELGWSPTYGSFHETARFGTLSFMAGPGAGAP